VKQLRPEFLEPGPTGRGARGDRRLPGVIVDNVPAGGVEALRSIPARQVAEIRFLGRGEAYRRFGAAQLASVILVTRKR